MKEDGLSCTGLKILFLLDNVWEQHHDIVRELAVECGRDSCVVVATQDRKLKEVVDQEAKKKFGSSASIPVASMTEQEAQECIRKEYPECEVGSPVPVLLPVPAGHP